MGRRENEGGVEVGRALLKGKIVNMHGWCLVAQLRTFTKVRSVHRPEY